MYILFIKELRELKQAFELFDKNNDGTINLSEMKEVMKSLGRDPTEEELKGNLHYEKRLTK